MMVDEPRRSPDDSKDVELDIALAEYEHLRIARQISFQGSGARFNFYLVAVVGSPAALGLAADVAPEAIPWISGPLLLSVVALGLFTFFRLIEFDYWSTYYTRGLNYLRKYFLGRAEGLTEYFVLPSEGDRPRFLDQHGLVRTAGFINSVLVATAAGLGTGSALDNNGIGFVSGGVALAVSWRVHVAYVMLKRDAFPKRYRRELPTAVLRPPEDEEKPLKAKGPSERLARPIARLLRRMSRED
jgi:hypothetical protein